MAAPRKPSASSGAHSARSAAVRNDGRADGDLQVARRLLVAAEAAQQAPERQARGGGLVAAALREQAFVDQARLAQLARAGARARLVDRGAGAAVQRGGARPQVAARSAVRPASKKRPRSAKASATATRSASAVVPSAISVARAGRLRVQRQAHGQAAIAQRLRQRQRIDEPPHPLVERDRAPQLAAVGRDARGLDVGAVRDQVLDDVVGGRFHDRDPASVAMILGVLGGSGLYDLDGLADARAG